jgi:hypothetical protein
VAPVPRKANGVVYGAGGAAVGGDDGGVADVSEAGAIGSARAREARVESAASPSSARTVRFRWGLLPTSSLSGVTGFPLRSPSRGSSGCCNTARRTRSALLAACSHGCPCRTPAGRPRMRKGRRRATARRALRRRTVVFCPPSQGSMVSTRLIGVSWSFAFPSRSGSSGRSGLAACAGAVGAPQAAALVAPSAIRPLVETGVGRGTESRSASIGASTRRHDDGEEGENDDYAHDRDSFSNSRPGESPASSRNITGTRNREMTVDDVRPPTTARASG